LALLGRLEKKTNPRLAVRLLETAMEKCCISKNDFKLPLITDLLWCYRELNDRDKEGQLIFQAISTFGDAAHIWKEAANFFLDRKDLKEVIHCLEKAVSLAPEAIEFHAELSRIYSQAGDVQRANVIVLDYLSSRLSKPSEIYFLGLALYKSGARELAELAYDRVRDDPLVSYWGSYDSLL
jgi:tetratricopeptide (TPR) repeat protein